MSFGTLAFTPLVKELQERYGSRQQYERMEQRSPSRTSLGEMEKAFLAERDSFYWATVGSTGWPYVQHRGGPKGFLRVIDDQTLVFPDYHGNKQFISTGNLLTDNRAAMIMIDYPQQARLKILGRVKVYEGEQANDWLERLDLTKSRTAIERVFEIHLEAFDWNCQQHITPRYTAEEIREAVSVIEDKLQSLEAENAQLRRQLADLRK